MVWGCECFSKQLDFLGFLFARSSMGSPFPETFPINSILLIISDWPITSFIGLAEAKLKVQSGNGLRNVFLGKGFILEV